MMKYYWCFSLSSTRLIIRTPWFAVVWVEYSKCIFNHAVEKGIEICWKRTQNVKEGDFFFQKSFKLVTDYLSMYDQHLSCPYQAE